MLVVLAIARRGFGRMPINVARPLFSGSLGLGVKSIRRMSSASARSETRIQPWTASSWTTLA